MPETMMNIFEGDAFSMVSLTGALHRLPYLPTFLGGLNLFEADYLTTTDVAIELANGRMNLIPTTERGAPLPTTTPETTKIKVIRTPRLAKESTIYAHQIQNVRPFEQAVFDSAGNRRIEMVGVPQVVANIVHQAQAKLHRDLQLTWELHRLGAVQGVLLDADGTRVIYNWFTEFGVSQPAEVDWNLDAAPPTDGTAPVRARCATTIRTVRDLLQGLWIDGSSYLLGLAGDNFFDNLTQLKELRETYLNTSQAADLRDNLKPGEMFRYGGITWVNYRGNGTVSINTDQVKFIPVNVPGLFRVAYSPAEFLPYVNTPALDMYSMLILDRDRQAWVKPEVYSYPLHYCTVPEALLRGRRT